MELEPTWLSILPAVVTIVLAFATRQVLVALFAGIVTGGVAAGITSMSAAWPDGSIAVLQAGVRDGDFLHRFLIPALGTSAYAKILLIYLWSLGGLMGIWEKTGGALHFAKVVGAAVARGPRSSLLFGWLLGLVFHQGGTVSTVLAGSTVKPVTDAHRVSHEELAYVVDSTASPVATVLPFNAWPAYVAALVVGTIPLFPEASDAISFFFTSIPFNFYAVFAVAGTGLFAAGVLPAFGAMGRARVRSRTTGALDRDGASPMLPERPVEVHEGYQPHLVDFLAPIGILLAIAVVPAVLKQALGVSGPAPSTASWGYQVLSIGLDKEWINVAFPACTLTAMVLAFARGLPLRKVLDGFIDGCRAMTIGAIVLGLAVTLGYVSKELHTAQWIVSIMGDALPAFALPAILMALCMAIAFSTGTSWGTYAVVFPIAMPLAWEMYPDPMFIALCFGAVLGGSVFGDQCSPISDTTILSGMFTGCDLMDHVNTQLPMALLAAGLGAVLATVIAVPVTAGTPVAAVEVTVVDGAGAVVPGARVAVGRWVDVDGPKGTAHEVVGDWPAQCIDGAAGACQRWGAGWGEVARWQVTATWREPAADGRCFDVTDAVSADVAPSGATLTTQQVTLTLDLQATRRECSPERG